MHSQLLYSSNCQLGEGLHWDHSRQLLWFVDIDRKNLVSLDIDSMSSRVIQMPEKIGWAITEENSDELILGLKSGIAAINPDKKNIKFNWITRQYPKNDSMRLNDAKADNNGFIWLGALNDNDQNLPEGSLARLDKSGDINIVDYGYKVPNGPAIDSFRKRFFHTDSLRRTIYQFDIDTDTSELSNKRIWKKFDKGFGFPDGMCLDKEGYLWVAHWGAGIVTRLNSNANVVNSVNIPTPNVTNVCFAGLNRDRLIVSSAQDGGKIDTNDKNTGSIFEIANHETSGAEVFSSKINQN